MVTAVLLLYFTVRSNLNRQRLSRKTRSVRLFVSQVSISASVSESLFAAAEAEEWLFLERFEELFIDLCQSTKHCAVAAAPISLFS